MAGPLIFRRHLNDAFSQYEEEEATEKGLKLFTIIFLFSFIVVVVIIEIGLRSSSYKGSP